MPASIEDDLGCGEIFIDIDPTNLMDGDSIQIVLEWNILCLPAKCMGEVFHVERSASKYTPITPMSSKKVAKQNRDAAYEVHIFVCVKSCIMSVLFLAKIYLPQEVRDEYKRKYASKSSQDEVDKVARVYASFDSATPDSKGHFTKGRAPSRTESSRPE